MKIDCYRNLNKGCVSVKSREPSDYGRVVSHEEKVTLRDVEFVVRPTGGAFVRGEWDEREQVIDGDYVTYNPFRHDGFYSPALDSYVSSADRAAVTRKGVFAKGLSK